MDKKSNMNEAEREDRRLLVALGVLVLVLVLLEPSSLLPHEIRASTKRIASIKRKNLFFILLSLSFEHNNYILTNIIGFVNG
jgi:Na+/citrate or Na+/malate symporter